MFLFLLKHPDLVHPVPALKLAHLQVITQLILIVVVIRTVAFNGSLIPLLFIHGLIVGTRVRFPHRGNFFLSWTIFLR